MLLAAGEAGKIYFCRFVVSLRWFYPDQVFRMSSQPLSCSTPNDKQYIISKGLSYPFISFYATIAFKKIEKTNALHQIIPKEIRANLPNFISDI